MSTKCVKNVRFSEKAVINRVAKMSLSLKEHLKGDIENMHVCISRGNSKTGSIRSVSLLPILFCRNCEQCKNSCYDVRNDLRHKKVIDSRARNSAILLVDRDRYFQEIDFCIGIDTYFRWHIGGDIMDLDYLERMVKIAEHHPKTTFLAFTKMYDVVNAYLDEHRDFPENFKIIMSAWKGLKENNPYDLPSSHVMEQDGTTTAHDGAKLCTGNCTDCAVRNDLCWVAKKGDEIVFPIH